MTKRTAIVLHHSLLSLLAILLLVGTPFSAEAQISVRLSERDITIRGEHYLVHTVRKGETLYAIAKAYTVSQEDIMRANSLTRDVLRNKQTLLIPQSAQKRHPNTAATTPEPQMEPITPSIPPRTSPPVPRTDKIAGRSPFQEEVIATQTDTIVAPSETTEAQTQAPFSGRLRDFDRNAPLNVAVLLPLQPGLKTNDNFSDFYKGILLGLNALKAEGISVSVRFMNTGASEEKVRDHIRSGALQKADLIIGPVYADAFGPVAEYAAGELGGVPIVSPLGSVGAENNPYVYEASPAKEHSYDRIFEMFGGGNGSPSAAANIIVIDHIEHPDTAALAQIEAHLGDRASTLAFTGVQSQNAAMQARLNAVLDKDRDNIIYVPVNQVPALESVLSHLSSISSNGRYRITVIGTPRWAWLTTIKFDLFFKLNVHYPASYHVDRSDPAVAAFYHEYISSFGGVPTPFSFRGYDVIQYFAGALKRFGANMPAQISDGAYNPVMLQVGYDYRQDQDSTHNTPAGGGKYKNVAWPIVNYKPDYTIKVIR